MSKTDGLTRWSLYLDESGNFADLDHPISIAGLLLRDDAEYSPAACRAELERAVPWCPWPLHASHVNQVAYVALAWYDRFEQPPMAVGPFAQAARDAVQLMRLSEPDLVAEVLRALRERKKPDVPALKELTNLLRSHRRTFYVLRDGVRDAWAQVCRAGTKLAQGGASAFQVAASETQTGDAGSTADQRYFQGIEVLLERVTATLCRFGGDHRVGVRVLARDIFDLRVECSRRLMPQDVGSAIRRIQSDCEGHVRLISETVEDYDAHVELPFVLADFFANRSRRTLSQVATPIRDAERDLANRLGVPVRSGNPACTHLAATGEALRMLRTSNPGVSPQARLPWVLPRRRWAVEQAWEWASV